nr:ATP-binding protein [Oceaniovalibus guishaninsula]
MAGTAFVSALAGFLCQPATVRGSEVQTIEALYGADTDLAFVTDARGAIVWVNDAAQRRASGSGPNHARTIVSDCFADPAVGVTDLIAQAAEQGRASRRIGRTLVTVRLMPGTRLFWTVETETDLMIAPDALAWLRMGRSGGIVAASPAFLAKVPDPIRWRQGLDSQDIAMASDRPVLLNDQAGGRLTVLLGGPDGAIDAVLLPSAGLSAVGHESALDLVPVPVLQIDAEGRVSHANGLARDLLELPDTAAKPMLADLFEGLGRPVGEWLDDAFGGRISLKPEVLRAARPDAELFVQVTLGHADMGTGPKLLAVLHDATELKTLEAQFVQSQKMQAIGQLAGGVAHDFNNLLTAIGGHCDLLLLRHDAGDQDFADLEQINQNANRAAALVRQLLAFSRKQNLQPEMIDLREALSELTHLLNRLVGEKVTLTFDHDPDLHLIRADRRQIEQVIVNLVVNARDAMPSGGRVRISTRMRVVSDPLQRDRVTVPAGRYVLVQVRDEGHGIPHDKLPKIFEPFFTTKRVGEGTGLGLSTAYGIVKQTGGYIFADSDAGLGAEFSLLFPAHDPACVVKSEPAIIARSDVASKAGEGVVLLVEDEPPVRAFACRALRLWGFTVIEAEDAESALEKLSDPDLHIDVFVTDVIMPGRDGPSWVQEALRTRPDVRVVFISGYAQENFHDTQTRIPNSVFLPKPFSLTDLTKIVQDQMV